MGSRICILNDSRVKDKVWSDEVWSDDVPSFDGQGGGYTLGYTPGHFVWIAKQRFGGDAVDNS